MKRLSAAEAKAFRTLVIALVMGTDMKQHFSLISQFSAKHRLASVEAAAHLARPDSVGGGPDGRDVGCSSFEVRNSTTSSGLFGAAGPLDDDEKLLGLQLGLKIADMRAVSQPIAVRWWGGGGRSVDHFLSRGEGSRDCSKSRP